MIKDNGIEYELDLPEGYQKVENLLEAWKLKPGSKTKTVNDYEIREDLKLYYFNPLTLEFYPKKLHKSTDTEKLKKYFSDGNLFINKDDIIWPTKK